jgi:hypothetical protein
MSNKVKVLEINFVLCEQKNEKHVVLTLLEVARRGAKLGMLAPMLVQFEQQIDIELARSGLFRVQPILIYQRALLP